MNTNLQANTATCTIVAPSSREALRLVREKLGPDAIIVSNRVTDQGVEIVAMLEESVTVQPTLAAPVVVPEPMAAPHPPAVALPSAPNITSMGVGVGVGVGDDACVLREIHSMRGMIEEQLAGIVWNEAQRRDPVRGHLLRTLLGAGFSARLAKDILADLPTGQSYAVGLAYVKSTLARQLPILENEDALMDEGGVFALMGPTGVGKTTTTAKLAARYVMRFGPEKLALVTTDSYRIGAYEQLRIYGQILGVSVHAVKDAVDLELVLSDLRDKHMVLIDTVGRSQRDRAVSEQIAMLCGASRPVKRLLLLNATSHGDTLNEVVQAYRRSEKAGSANDLVGCIFTKVDEATHPGVLIDMAIRHRLPVHYVSSGQKVPEHLALGDRSALVDSVFQAKSPSAFFVPGEADLGERPSAPGNEAGVVAAEAVSARLRLQCHQLIRALTHNAEELTINASALSAGQIGFDETRDLWRQLSAGQVGQKAIAKTLLLQARTGSEVSCSNYVLTVAGEISLTLGQRAEGHSLFSHLALSDRTGLPLAAPFQWLAKTEPHGGVQQQKSEKPVIQLLARVPASELMRAWQSGGLQWAATATGSQRIAAAASGAPATLAKLAAGLAFGASEPVLFRKKSALVSVAEALVSLRPDSQASSAHADAAPLTLRCVIRRIVDVDSGKALAHSYVLASTGVQATAQQIAQWPAWRAAAEPYFKLLNQSIPLLGDGAAVDGSDLPKRLLIAGQACTTVFRLQRAQDAWADTARKVLAQLAGRSVRPDRAVPGLALFEGLGKLFALLDALETEGAAASPRSDLAPAQS
ncbi:flagellar biosynthesis protein FlhF [Polaromonas sp.]|uniref:flagellar biosynthesis protein FlhF n=1 Tax=Polaromonas sp. TaxID=1869339 RepID=UPI0017F6C529|nr:flagellar biosynthesis protein FlhF [Polaromonas sp.]NMM08581.1 flagellar biosynthesis protein FlhF [Polaromonas sp.]